MGSSSTSLVVIGVNQVPDRILERVAHIRVRINCIQCVNRFDCAPMCELHFGRLTSLIRCDVWLVNDYQHFIDYNRHTQLTPFILSILFTSSTR